MFFEIECEIMFLLIIEKMELEMGKYIVYLNAHDQFPFVWAI